MIDVFGLQPTKPIDRLTLYWYATLARSAYQGHTGPNPIAALAGASSVQFRAASQDTEWDLAVPSSFLLKWPDGKSIIVIRGTAREWEWRWNINGFHFFDIDPSPFAVSGYPLQAAKAIWDHWSPQILSGITWTVCGHSLGGQIASILATPVFGHDRPAVCVDFGTPRAGNIPWARAQTTPRLRVTNYGDPVPSLPPAELYEAMAPFNVEFTPSENTVYQHWGFRIMVWEDGRFSFPEGDRSFSGEVADFIFSRFVVDPDVFPHERGEYPRRIRAGIPVPLGEADPDYPGVEVLDAANLAWNVGELPEFNEAAWAPGGDTVFRPIECR